MPLALKGKSPLPKTDILYLFDTAKVPTLALKNHFPEPVALLIAKMTESS